MSIYHPAPTDDKSPHCATGGCPNSATLRGTLRVHDEVFRDVAYCTECAGFLYQQFEIQHAIEQSALTWVRLPAEDVAFIRGFDPDRDRTASRADMVRVIEHLQAALDGDA